MTPRERIEHAAQAAQEAVGVDTALEPAAFSRAYGAAAREALTILEEQIRQRFTPALNAGSALDGLRLVGEAIRALRAELTDAEQG